MPRARRVLLRCRRRRRPHGGDSKSAARDLRPGDADEDFHEARKRAKSARYTAELIAPLLGRRAARGAGEFIRLTTKLQDTLGEHQDALITLGELERHSPRVA